MSATLAGGTVIPDSLLDRLTRDADPTHAPGRPLSEAERELVALHLDDLAHRVRHEEVVDTLLDADDDAVSRGRWQETRAVRIVFASRPS